VTTVVGEDHLKAERRRQWRERPDEARGIGPRAPVKAEAGLTLTDGLDVKRGAVDVKLGHFPVQRTLFMDW
jgi:hypothetical protein